MAARPTGKDDFEWMPARARAVPYLIIVYVLALAALRLSMSQFLEIDEAEFVGQVDWRMVYANSHPPLYNWVLRILLELTGWNWPLSITVLKYGLLAGFYLLTWDTARRIGGTEAGLFAIVASAFLPQIIWQSAHTLSHSTMVMTGTVALIHAAFLVWQTPRFGSYIWLGIAAAFGALAKFNFFLFAAPFLVALAADKQLRERIFTWKALPSLTVFAIATTPVFVAALRNLETSSQRLAKLYRSSYWEWLDVPRIGIDGFVSLLVSVVLWAGPLALIWYFARPRSQAPSANLTSNAPFVRALGWGMLGALAIFAVIVLVGDVHRVSSRYLTPLLAGLPIWVATRHPIGARRELVLGIAILLFVCALPGVFAMVQTQKHRYAIPYSAVAEEIRAMGVKPQPILARYRSDAANLTLALGWHAAKSPRYPKANHGALLVWRGSGAPPPALVPQRLELSGVRRTIQTRYLNMRDDEIIFSFQVLKPR